MIAMLLCGPATVVGSVILTMCDGLLLLVHMLEIDTGRISLVLRPDKGES